MKKLGQELVFATVPPTHHKLLLNVLKMHDNTKKLKSKREKERKAAGQGTGACTLHPTFETMHD